MYPLFYLDLTEMINGLRNGTGNQIHPEKGIREFYHDGSFGRMIGTTLFVITAHRKNDAHKHRFFRSLSDDDTLFRIMIFVFLFFSSNHEQEG